MSKIKCGFFRNGKNVAFTVYWMDERFRRKEENFEYNFYKAKNGFSIKSANYPEISKNSLYIYGTTKDRDCEIDFYSYQNEEKAIENIENFKIALAEWAENWEGFNEKPKQDNVSNNNLNEIFEV